MGRDRAKYKVKERNLFLRVQEEERLMLLIFASRTVHLSKTGRHRRVMLQI